MVKKNNSKDKVPTDLAYFSR